nr:hypothetical protein [Tanacetum cinerariifolium]
MIKEIDQDAKVTLVTPTQVSTHGETYTRRWAVSTSSGGVSTASKMISTTEEAVSTVGASMPVSTASMVYKALTFTKEEWENIKARVEVDEEETQRLQEVERNTYSEVDQAKMLVGLINKKRYFAEQKFEAKRKKPMTQAQDAKEDLDQGRSKKQKIGESSEPRNKDVDELSQEELQQLIIIVPEQEMNVKALQTKYPIIDWEIYTEDTRKY